MTNAIILHRHHYFRPVPLGGDSNVTGRPRVSRGIREEVREDLSQPDRVDIKVNELGG